jgi:ArsR family transcriptional regulator
MDDYLKVLHALADEIRLRILNLMYERDLCVCDITHVLGIKQSNASRHLTVLKNAGIIKSRKSAQWNHHYLVKEELPEYMDPLIIKVLRKQRLYTDDLNKLKAIAKDLCKKD